MKRTVAVLVEPRRFEIIEEEIPSIGDDELLVRVTASGICHSDLPSYLGESAQSISPQGVGKVVPVPFPLRFGHEGVGIVEAVGKNIKGFAPGDCVTGMIKPAYASHTVVSDTRMLFKVPEGPRNPNLCISEPIMCIVNILRVATPEFGDTVAVVGCGGMGLLTIAGLKNASGAKNIVAVDLSEHRLDWARRMGATHTLNPVQTSVQESVYELTGGLGAQVVIEISGSLSGLDTALSMLQDASMFDGSGRGKLLIPSLYGRDAAWSGKTGYALMFKAPVIHSTHPRYAVDVAENFRRAIGAYMDGTLPFEETITHRFSLERLGEGFELMLSGEETMIKGIVEF